MTHFFVEFEIADDASFERLRKTFEALAEAKRTNDWRSAEHWLGFFDEKARSSFWWPTPEEIDRESQRWFATPVSQRLSDPTFHNRWLFDSFIEAFRNGEYDLLTCREVPRNGLLRFFTPRKRIGRLYFEPHAFPFGGDSCLRQLAKAFGHRPR